MTPAIPSADPLPLPAPVGLLWFLLLLTFFLHVIAMNSVLGGSIIAAALRWKKPAGEHPARLAHLMGKGMPVAVASTVTLGVAALLFLQVLYGRLFFTSAVLMAWPWLSVVALVIVAYYGTYAIAFERTARARGLSLMVAALVIVVAFIYSNNMSLMLRPEAFREMYVASGQGLHFNLADRVLYPRYLHMVTGAIAVAGLVVCVIGAMRRRQEPAFGAWALNYGARWCMVATIANLAAGVWFLGVLPTPVLLMLIGQDIVGASLLGVGIVAAGCSVTLAMVATRSSSPGREVAGSAVAMALALALMLLVRDFVRRKTLDLAGFQPQTWVSTDWGPIVIFFVLLVAAIGLVGWMAWALATRPAEQAQHEVM